MKHVISMVYLICISFFLVSCSLLSLIYPKCNISILVTHLVIPYQGSKKYYKYLQEIPPYFKGYKIKKIHEVLEGKEWRENLFTIRVNDSKYPLTETSRKFVLDTDYIIIKNVLVSGLCIFGRNDTLISLYGNDTPQIEYPIVVRDHFYSAIVLSHFPIAFGALFYNLFFCITIIPENAIKKSVLIVSKTNNKIHNLTKEIYSILYGYQKVYSFKPNEYALVDELHTVINPTPGIQHFSTSVYNMSILLRKKFNLTTITPSVYAFVNRGKNYKRHIFNIDELISNANKIFPGYNWTLYEDEYNTFLETSKVWATFKVLFTITGSNLIRSVAMAPGTGICCIFGNRFDWEVVTLTEIFGIFLYALPIISIRHFKFSNNIVDVSLAMNALKATVYAEKNKKWSPETLKENAHYKKVYVVAPGLTLHQDYQNDLFS